MKNLRDILDSIAANPQMTRYHVQPATYAWLLRYGYIEEHTTPMGFLHVRLTEKGKRRLCSR